MTWSVGIHAIRTRVPLRHARILIGVITGVLMLSHIPAAHAEKSPPPTVLVGVAGLRWGDIHPTITPTLWRMVRTSAVGVIPGKVGPQETCIRDAWATLGAGQLVTSPATPTPTEVTTDPTLSSGCPPIPAVSNTSDALGPALLLNPISAEESPAQGALTAALTEAGSCATAVGPGAALMLADATGRVSRYSATVAAIPEAELATCPVLVIDAGALPDTTPDRRQARQALDQQVAELKDLLPRDSRIVVAGIADTVPNRPELQVVIDGVPPGGQALWLTSESTRHQGIAELLNLTGTLAEAGGVSDHTLGAPLVAGNPRHMGVSRTVETLRYHEVLGDTLESLMPIFVGIILLALLTLSGVSVWMSRRLTVRARRIFIASYLVIAAAPVAATLASLSRWWVRSSPTLVVTACLSIAMALMAICAWALHRILPRKPLALAAATSAVSWLILTVDGLTGAGLQHGSLLGPSPSLGARFYGFNNMTFAIYAAAGLILAGSIASLITRGRVVAVVLIGAVTLLVDGWPSFGADFGGVLALVPAFSVLTLAVAQAQVTWRRILAIAGVTTALVMTLAVIDWLGPGAPSHMGLFVQNLLDGQAFDVIERKIFGAWSTIAQPAGALASLVLLGAALGMVGPQRLRIAIIARAEKSAPGLRPIHVSLLVAAITGSLLNDSGIIIAVLIAVVAAATLIPSLMTPATLMTSPQRPRMVHAIVAISGAGLVIILFMTHLVAGLMPQSQARPAEAGQAVLATDRTLVSDDQGIVVIGTIGLTWEDISAEATPTISTLLADGAAASGSSQPTGEAHRCLIGGWTTLSAGQLTTVATTNNSGRWDCPTVYPIAADGGARILGWDHLQDLQTTSPYHATLGQLGEQLRAASCVTAVGPGAALALADRDGTVARYRSLHSARQRTTDAFTCPVTLVDAGSMSTEPTWLPANIARYTRYASRVTRAKAIDTTIADLLRRIPPSTPVVIMDVTSPAASRPVLGVTVARPGLDGPRQARYLTSAATRTDAVTRTLDLPATMLAAAGLTPQDPLQNTALTYGSLRPADLNTTRTELVDLTERDFIRRDLYLYFVNVPLYLGAALLATSILLRRKLASPTWHHRYLRSGLRGLALFLSAVPAASYLVSLADWWSFAAPGRALLWAAGCISAIIAGVAGLAPRKPLWAAPGIIAGITFVTLTVDGLVGTPLNRASPLGSAPTFGARFYGFSNPTFSIYAVAAMILAAALAQWFLQRGRRLPAVGSIAAIGVIAMVVDVWPTFGADVGGGLVLVPGFAIVALSASGATVTWRRVLMVAGVGVGAVGLVGVIDWMRPAAEQTHLGRFTGQVIAGEAWDILARKAGFAIRSVNGSVPVVLTLVVLILVGLLLFARTVASRPGWVQAQGAWPLLRPVTLGLWIVFVAGSLVNDFGIRIAMIGLVAAIPLYAVVALEAPTSPPSGDPDAQT